MYSWGGLVTNGKHNMYIATTQISFTLIGEDGHPLLFPVPMTGVDMSIVKGTSICSKGCSNPKIHL